MPLLGGAGNFNWNAANYSKFDGLGAYRYDYDTLRVFVNHENAAGSVSQLDLNVRMLQSWITNRVVGNNNSNYAPRPAGLIEGMSKAWTSVGGGLNQNLTLNRPCSGNVWEANAFGSGRGFTDQLYMTGEETFGTNPTGNFWVIDTASSTLYRAGDVGGLGSWENATLIDTGRNDTIALLLGEDRGSSATGTAKLSLYVGQKNPSSSSFLERNGLAGGKTYYWDANGTSNTDGTVGTGGLFANNNDSVLGTWTQSTTQAVLFSKAEDVHTNMQINSPGFGKEAVLASQGEAIFSVDFSGLTFTSGDLASGSQSHVKVLFKSASDADPAGTFDGFDNVVWSPDGNIYVNEDDGEGDIWQIKVADLLAQYQANNLNPTLQNVFQILDADPIGAHPGGVALGITESSGIIDISSLVGYEPGSIFLTNGMGSTGDQVAIMISPKTGNPLKLVGPLLNASNIAAIPEPNMHWFLLALGTIVATHRTRRMRI